MEKGNKNRHICFIHDDIISMCKDITSMININPDANKKKIAARILKISNFTKDAKIHGENMEKRLQDYRYTIEGLGFERKK